MNCGDLNCSEVDKNLNLKASFDENLNVKMGSRSKSDVFVYVIDEKTSEKLLENLENVVEKINSSQHNKEEYFEWNRTREQTAEKKNFSNLNIIDEKKDVNTYLLPVFVLVCGAILSFLAIVYLYNSIFDGSVENEPNRPEESNFPLLMKLESEGWLCQ